MKKEWGKIGLITLITKDKAKELWEKDGRKQGRDLDYWLQAEKIIKGQIRIV